MCWSPEVTHGAAIAADPRDMLMSFIESLPRTIRGEMLMFLQLYAGGGRVSLDDGRSPSHLREHLMAGGTAAVGRLLAALAAIDFSLETMVARAREAEPVLRRLAEDCSGSAAFRESYLSLPLRRRHGEQALSDWRRLRETALTTSALRAFEEEQLGLRHK
ncbi:MAG TPA: hypothetical protein VMH86_00995 [Rhizomicrobium sp.]|nr:hypothetical protein [Rhizomicrobium sp.]